MGLDAGHSWVSRPGLHLGWGKLARLQPVLTLLLPSRTERKGQQVGGTFLQLATSRELSHGA